MGLFIVIKLSVEAAGFGFSVAGAAAVAAATGAAGADIGTACIGFLLNGNFSNVGFVDHLDQLLNLFKIHVFQV